jgi:hypothetical protein
MMSYLRNNDAYQLHFINGEPVAAHDIAIGAGSLNVAFDVRQGVIYSVKAAIVRGCSAVATWLFDHLQNLSARQVAGINSLICLSEKCSPAPLRLIPSLHASGAQNALVRRQVAPPLFSAVASFFSRSVTHLALVSQSQWSACVFQENISRSWQFLFTSVANAMHRLCGYTSYPAHKIKFNLVRINCQCGPH